MFDTLRQFYNSEEWRAFRKQLIHERTSSDGILYDEHSGKPLMKAYDIILHHKRPLTSENVNDYSISLNPDNIMIVSHRSHNEIHARFGFCTQKVYYVFGPPCAGKTTFVNSVKGNSDIILDIDNIWQCVTGGERYVKPNALKTNVFTIRDCIIDMIRTRAGRWENAYVIDGGARRSDRDRLISLLGAEPVYIDTDRATCMIRLASDEKRTQEQKEQWARYIDEWFENYTE